MSEEDLQDALRLREAIYGLVHDCLADRALNEQYVDDLNAIAARPDPVPRITVSREICFAAGPPAAAALSAIARDAIQLLGAPDVTRLRECAAPDCAFLFLDTSPAGRRRWCAMNRCGNRQHVRDHRERTRPNRPSGRTPAASGRLDGDA